MSGLWKRVSKIRRGERRGVTYLFCEVDSDLSSGTSVRVGGGSGEGRRRSGSEFGEVDE